MTNYYVTKIAVDFILASILSNLEHQCFDLKNCLQQIKEEESFVRESLVSVQTLSESLSMEKHELSQLLNQVRHFSFESYI